ncbi:hypothetical protein [Limosilactobacillus reuteri]|uniref:Uncharacterized protein n=1 Tax=Limosilactobacillus reuteri TaxID=1598 RepID=A0A347T8V3_LIMRT|nr:hypothetical protein [Limosilactobacillus reuteri]AXX74352.1 hypothetical protein DL317_06315 [Limosilactobacillus reuteri]MRG68572.1 hypothetical protein [Limosilactobacillus reuteri]
MDIMEILGDLFSLIFLGALICVIIFAIMWFRTNREKDKEKYQKSKKYTIISTIMLVIGLVDSDIFIPNDEENSASTEQTSKISSSSKTSSAEALNNDLTTADTGNTKWTWNKEDACWEATVDQNSTMYQSMNSGQVSLWNSYVRDIQEVSQIIADEKLDSMATFKVLTPTDQNRCFLIVSDGKIKYNIGEDLAN